MTETIKKLQQYLAQNKLGGAVITDIFTVNYLTGFPFVSNGDAFLVITPKKATCYTKEMYLIDIKNKCPFLNFVNSLDINKLVKHLDKEAKNFVFDPYASTYINGTALYKAGVKEMPKITSLIRETKTKEEIKNIKTACQISAKSFEIFKNKLKAGMTEIQAAKLLESIMAENGGQGLAFDTIMAFGKNTANPHHANSNLKLKNEMPVLVDFGCRYKGYCSDMTRTFWFGKKPSAEFKHYFEAVFEAYTVASKALKEGKGARELDTLARNYFEDNFEAAKYFIHSLGHNLGLEIHEHPILSQREEGTVKENAITTVEPGLYFKNKFGIRYEDTFLITKTGSINLTAMKTKK